MGINVNPYHPQKPFSDASGNAKSTDTFYALPDNLAQNERTVELVADFLQRLSTDMPIDWQKYPMNDLMVVLISEAIGEGIMKSSPKKEKNTEQSEEVSSYVRKFADTIMESLKENYDSKLEPFADYENKARRRFYEHTNSFKTRFAEGYEVLLKELAQERE